MIVFQLTQAPQAIEAEILTDDPEIDLSEAASAEFRATLKRTGAAQTWAAIIVEQASDRLLIRHTFDSAGAETATPGEYLLSAALTIPGGIARTEPTTLSIWSR
jgi:hypothetical protein